MIDPHGMGLIDWADSVILSVGDAFAFSRLDDESKWQDWAVVFSRADPFTQRNVPDPYQFDDWREWAMLAYPMLEGTG